jgi:hypothetical protein
MNQSHYPRLLAMTVLSFVSMYLLMYAMVDSASSVYNSINQIYMAGLMTAPMVALELLLMGGMYPNKRLNTAIVTVSIAAGITLFVFIRQQTAIDNTQFLRSMIPHHSGAILMCERGSITDERIRQLCRTIIAGQQKEIDQMTMMLGEM